MSKQEELSKRKSLLSPAKQALLAKLTRGEQKTELSVIPRRFHQETAALSFAQQRLWFIDQLAPGTPAYNIPIAIRLTGSLDLVALHQSLHQVVERHEVLRTTFRVVDNQPMQAIAPSLTLPLPTVDLRDIPINEREVEVSKLTTAASLKPFNLTQGPLLRATLLQLSDQEHVMLLVMHHIISDGWSLGILIQEMAMFYTACSQQQVPQLPQLPIQYADFSEWQRNWLQGEVLQTQLNYWKQQLGGDLPILELPTDYPRLPVQTFTGKKHSFVIPQPLSEALVAISQQEGATLFMTLLAAFQILLHRYTRQEDICVGSPIANRNRSEIEGLIGFFVNTLVLRTDLGNNPTFRELLQRVRQVTLGAYAHQDLPFEKLVEELQPERNLSHTPLFQVMFVLLNTPMPTVELPSLTLSPVELNTETAIFDLTLFMWETEQGLMGSLEYNSNLFDADTISRMAEHLQNLLQAIALNPETRVSEIPLLSAAEQQKLLIDWNNTQVDYPMDSCIHQLFEAQVEQTPDAVAVVFENEQLTYRQLNHRANQLAHYLQSLGVGAEVLVGICVERSIEMLVGILGILKAGGAYVPLDSNYPPERLSYMLADSGVQVLLTQTKLLESLPLNHQQLVCLDPDWNTFSQQSQENPISDIQANNLAYVMYTSGSTGKPKGVSVIHRGVVRLVKETNYANLTAEETFLQLAPISFDAATFEIWGSLLNGGRLVIFPPHTPSLKELGEVIQQYQVTTLWLTAGLFHLMVDENLDGLKPLRQLLAGGDVLSVPHVQKFLETVKNCKLINGYGPTENTTFSCCQTILQPLPAGVPIPIGRAIANTQVYILDKHLQPTPIGVPGELYVGGDGLARGYFNRPELTAQKFIPNPFYNPKSNAKQIENPKFYKTGDLACYLPDGTIQFLGRIDNQVKIRGFRIELAEIETALLEHPEVQAVAVIVREDKPGDKRLVAYVVINQKSKIKNSKLDVLRDFLIEKLPNYMVPSAFVLLDQLPLTPNGKVDRKALLALEADSSSDLPYIAPRNHTEEIIANIFASVLHIQKVSIYDNFFTLGGNSLLAAQVISRVKQAFAIDISLRYLFEEPSVANLSKIVENSHSSLVQELQNTPSYQLENREEIEI